MFVRGFRRTRAKPESVTLARLTSAGLAIFVCGFAACKDIEEPDLLPALLGGSAANRIGVVSSDLGGAGRFGTISPEGLPQISFTPIHSDAVARYVEGRVYVINRLRRDNIQVLNPGAFYLTEVEFSTEAASNPHDIVLVDPGKAMISRYERASLWLADPRTGAFAGLIDLTGFADADGIPEMSGMHIEAGRVFVALQRLDRNGVVQVFPPTDFSSLIEMDGATNTILAEYRLPLKNPFGKLKRAVLFGKPHLVIPAPGGIGAAYGFDGGVIAFDLETRTSRPGGIYAESTAGGDILDVVVKNDRTAYATVLRPDLSTLLQRFDPTTGAQTGQLAVYPASAGFVAGLLLAPDGRLFVADASAGQPGIAIYDTNQGDRLVTPTPISVGLRPTDLIFIP